MTSDLFIGIAVGSLLGALITLIFISMCMHGYGHNSNRGWYDNSNDNSASDNSSGYGQRRYNNSWGSWYGWNNSNQSNYHGDSANDDQSDDRTAVTLLPKRTVSQLQRMQETEREIQRKGLYVWVWSKRVGDWVMRPIELYIGGCERFHLFAWNDSKNEFECETATNDFMKLGGAAEYIDQLDDLALINELCSYAVPIEDPDERPMKREIIKLEQNEEVPAVLPPLQPPRGQKRAAPLNNKTM